MKEAIGELPSMDADTIFNSFDMALDYVAAHSSVAEVKSSMESYSRQEDTLAIPGQVRGLRCPCPAAPLFFQSS